MKKIIALILAVAMIASLSVFASFAKEEILDINGDTLREVNDAQDVDESVTKSGPSWAQAGHWMKGIGGDSDWLVPFTTEGWAAAGVEGDCLVLMNWGNFIRVSKNIDLSKYTKMYITYSYASGAGSLSGYELGFFSEAHAFGQKGDKNDAGLVASVEIEEYEGANWNVPNTIELDLSKVDYKGELYISYYMEGGDGICITEIAFEVAEGGDTNPGDQTPGDTTPDDGDTTPDAPSNPGNAGTADSTAVVFMIAAAAVVATVLLKKRAF